MGMESTCGQTQTFGMKATGRTIRGLVTVFQRTQMAASMKETSSKIYGLATVFTRMLTDPHMSVTGKMT